jgi:hypothetical protein
MFHDCLKRGQSKEVEVAHLIERAGGEILGFNDTGSHDFSCLYARPEPHFVEVKCEDNYAKSRNISVEVLQGKSVSKASGLHVSKASLFIHTLGDMCVLYQRLGMVDAVARRRARCETTSDPLFKWFAKADNGNGGFIIPIDRLMAYPWCQHMKLSALASSTLWGRIESTC